jgi:O-antigen/teichoic acid export membrane protein
MSAAVGPDHDHPARAARRVVRNAAYLGAAEVANKLMMFSFYMLSARHLSSGGYGVLSLGIAFATMFSALTDLGLGTLTAREAARDANGARRTLASAVALKITASLVVTVLIAVVANLVGYPPATLRVIYVCSLMILPNAIVAYLLNVLQGLERMFLIPVCRAAQTGILAVGALLLARGPASADRYAFLYVVATCASAGIGVAALARWARSWLCFNLRAWRAILIEAMPMGLATVIVALYYWNGTAVLARLSGASAAGAFSAAMRLVWAGTFAGLAFSGALYPLMSRLARSDSQRLQHVLGLSVRYMAILALPIGALGVALARPLVMLVYGAGFSDAVPVLRILSWWGACACLNSLISSYFVAVDRPGVMTRQTLLSLSANVVGNVVLIPVLGAVGAATSLVLAEAVGVVYLASGLARSQGLPAVELNAAARGLPAVALSAAAGWCLARFGLLISGGVAMATYVVSLIVLRALGRRDMEFLRMLVRPPASLA